MVEIDRSAVLDAVSFVARHDHLPPGRFLVSDAPSTPATDPLVTFVQTFGVYRPSLGEVETLLAGGRSLVIHAIEWQLPALYQVVSDLETVGGRPCSGAAVLLGAFANHLEAADSDHDVVLLTTEGTTQLEPTHSSPRGPILLRPGEAAMLPSATGATLRALDSPATVVRITMPNGIASSDLADLAGLARFHPLLRCDVPTDLEQPVSSYAGSIYDDNRIWEQEVATLFSRRNVENLAAWRRALIPPRTSLDRGLMDLAEFLDDPKGRVRSPLHGGACVTVDDGELRIAAGGAVLNCVEPVAAAVASFLDGRPVDVDEVLHRLERVVGSSVASLSLLRLLVEAEMFEPI